MLSAARKPDATLRELYRELILDHAQQPRHFGRPPAWNREAEGVNPLCGDRLHLYLDLDGERIGDAAFEGSGCAISMASASLLTEAVRERTTGQALELADGVRSMLTGDAHGSDLGKLEALAGVREFPSRVKCASLAWHALRAALSGDEDRVSTE